MYTYYFITIFSVISAIMWCNLLIIILYFLRKNTDFIKNFTIAPLLFLAILCICRAIFVFELPFTITLETEIIYTTLYLFLTDPFIIFDNGTIISVLNLFVFIWIVGSLYFSVKLVISAIKVRNSLQTFSPVQDKKVLNILSTITSNEKKKFDIKVISSQTVSVPMVTGFLNPTIILPSFSISEKELFHILSHEWMHFKKKDSWIKLIFQILCIIFWWNPFIHLMRKNLDHMLEVRCDTEVVKKMSSEDKFQYLGTLLSIIKHSSVQGDSRFLKTASCSALVSTNKETMIEQRFKIVLSDEKKNKGFISLFYLGIIITFIISNLIIVQPAFYDAPDLVPGEPIEVTAENSYLLENEDGTYGLYVDDELFETALQEEELSIAPYSLLPIKKGFN